MGWLGLASAVKLTRRFGYIFITPPVYGGIAYTMGAVCLGVLSLAGDPMLIPGAVGRQELFHLAVLIGVALHRAFVYSFADTGSGAQAGIGQTVGTDWSTLCGLC